MSEFRVGDRVSAKARTKDVTGFICDIHYLAGGDAIFRITKDDTGTGYWCVEEDLTLLPPDEVLT